MASKSVLLAVADGQLSVSWEAYLRGISYEVIAITHCQAAEGLTSQDVGLAIVEWDLPPDGGESLVLDIHREHPQTKCFLVCGFVSGEMVDRARALGAIDCLELGGNISDLWQQIEEAASGETTSVVPDSEPGPLDALIGESAGMVELRSLVRRIADSRDPLLIAGESGTGKELVAKALHDLRCGDAMPFEAVNCAGIPEELLETTLFGHVKGAFTSAIRDSRGHMELAGEGTLFLDEIGDMSPVLQAKLLRATEERRFRPVGGDHDIHFAGRIVCATNQDLDDLMATGDFRSDLYYRIAVHTILIPALRERKGDIVLLARHFLKQTDTGEFKDLSPEAIQALEAYSFPGNVRELTSIVKQAALTAAHRHTIMRRDLPESVLRSQPGHAGADDEDDPYSLPYDEAKRVVLQRFQRDYLTRKMEEADGNQTEAARLAGTGRSSFCRLLSKHGLTRGRAASSSRTEETHEP